MPQSGTLPNLTGAFVDEGRLELVTILGAGAHGKVYKARDTTASSHSFYAVKCLRRPKSNTDADVIHARFQKREWSLHLRVSAHPNIVTLHRHFADSEHNFLVFDLSLGGDLHQAIVDGIYQGQTKLIKRTFTCIVDGVRFCHDRGVYHRDLKPENILVDLASGSVRIADFGLATTSKVSRAVGCGSSPYMAPESLSCISSSYRPQDNDVWALNIILINLISKMTPWHSACQCTPDYRWNFFMADLDFLRMVVPISVPLNDLLRRSFSVDPGHRPALMQLRHEVVAMPALYMSDADLRHASPRVRRAAAGWRVPPPEAHDPSDWSALGSDTDTSSGSGYSSLNGMHSIRAPGLAPVPAAPANLVVPAPMPMPPAGAANKIPAAGRENALPQPPMTADMFARALVVHLPGPGAGPSGSSSPYSLQNGNINIEGCAALENKDAPRGKFMRIMSRLAVWRMLSSKKSGRRNSAASLEV